MALTVRRRLKALEIDLFSASENELFRLGDLLRQSANEVRRSEACAALEDCMEAMAALHGLESVRVIRMIFVQRSG